MTRRTLLTLAVFLATAVSALSQDTMTVHQSVLSYLNSIISQPVDSICTSVDRLIDSIEGNDQKATVAGIAFDFFTESPVMGQEGVSVHIADEWFLSKKLKPKDESIYPLLYTYAEFNRSSLVGCSAPDFSMESIDSVTVTPRTMLSDLKVLFFYDTDCTTCRKEAPALAEIARKYEGGSLTIYAIYTQANRPAWEKFVAEQFSDIDNPNVTMVHLWDPEATTGYHKKYGVLTTPMMFLLDSQNKIIGRGLNCEALVQLLNVQNAYTQKYNKLFDRLFGAFEPLDASTVNGIVDLLYEKTLDQDEQVFSDMFVNLFNYLRLSDSSTKKSGAIHLAENYIAAMPERWSEEYLNTVIHALYLAKLNPVGGIATGLKLQNKRGKEKNILQYKQYYTLVFFHLIDCEQCEAEIKKLRKISGYLYDHDVKIVMVYVGHDKELWKKFIRQSPIGWIYLSDLEGTSQMRDLYDLEFVPHMYLLDCDKVIMAKDLSVEELYNLLPVL